MRLASLVLLSPLVATAGPPERRQAGLTAGPTAAAAPIGERDLAIYPGFAKHELPASVRATLDAAATCARHGSTDDPPRTRPAVAPYVSAEVVDGEPVELLVRRVELSCRARPVRRCAYTYAWQEGTDEVGYAAVQCFGSHGDAYTTYIVTATRDLRRAKKPEREGTPRDKALRLVSLSFQTTEFPGTHLSAFVGIRRRDGSERVAARVLQFDDYEAQDEELGSPVDGATLLELADDTLAVACVGVGQCAASGARAR